MKALVIGLGYVGEALLAYLSSKLKVAKGFDIKQKRKPVYKNYDSFFICVNTDFDEELGEINCSNVTSAIKDILAETKNCDIYIKSTVNIGYCDKIIKEVKFKRIFYCPEFLREKFAYQDLSNPSRIIIGKCENMLGIEHYLSLFSSDIPFIITNYKEAESIKLFSNAYLANRVAFFNEIDSFAEDNGLNASDIIHGVSLDSRIGNFYNKPSFGFGGYCLPKDSKTLSHQVHGKLLSAGPESNYARKQHIVNKILERTKDIEHPLVGIYKINDRYSPLDDIIYLLSEHDIGVILYEPRITEKFYLSALVITDIDEFKQKADLIITSKYETELNSVYSKLYIK